MVDKQQGVHPADVDSMRAPLYTTCNWSTTPLMPCRWLPRTPDKKDVSSAIDSPAKA